MTNESLIACCDNCLHHGRVVDFLRLIEFFSAGHTCRVVVRNVVLEFLDTNDLVTLHDLLVINIVENFQPFGSDGVANIDRPTQCCRIGSRDVLSFFRPRGY